MELFERYAKNELFRASFILLILMAAGNILNYFFQFIMARMLGPVDFGVLAVLTSIIYILNVPTTSIQTVVSKYATQLNSKKDFGRIKGMMNYFIRKALLVSLIAYVIYLLIAIPLSSFLGITFWLLAITGLFLFAAFLYPTSAGVLQGMKKFNVLGWNFVLNSILKIIIAAALVAAGFRVYGGIIGFVMAALISFIFIFPFIKEIVQAKETRDKTKIMTWDSFYTLAAMLVIALMYSIDIILARVFFSPEIVGRYAVLSMIGKIILFGSLAIGNAMFPISTERFISETREKSRNIIKKTLFILGILCAIAIALFAFFPETIISVLFGSAYASLSEYLFFTGLTYSAISFLSIYALYKISIDEFKIRHLISLAVLFAVQIAIMIIFHANLGEFVTGFMASSLISLITGILIMKKWKN